MMQTSSPNTLDYKSWALTLIISARMVTGPIQFGVDGIGTNLIGPYDFAKSYMDQSDLWLKFECQATCNLV